MRKKLSVLVLPYVHQSVNSKYIDFKKEKKKTNRFLSSVKKIFSTSYSIEQCRFTHVGTACEMNVRCLTFDQKPNGCGALTCDNNLLLFS
jgi:hypothetical protein